MWWSGIQHLDIVCFVVMDFMKTIVFVIDSCAFESRLPLWGCLGRCGTTKVGAAHHCIFDIAPMRAWCGFAVAASRIQEATVASGASTDLTWLDASSRPLAVSNSHQQWFNG